ncbi:MAG: hypothetical protein M3176_00990 [Chloroflexota bacterium]|nr:hypothetical protein [Chloroflexota bacterium]
MQPAMSDENEAYVRTQLQRPGNQALLHEDFSHLFANDETVRMPLTVQELGRLGRALQRDLRYSAPHQSFSPAPVLAEMAKLLDALRLMDQEGQEAVVAFGDRMFRGHPGHYDMLNDGIYAVHSAYEHLQATNAALSVTYGGQAVGAEVRERFERGFIGAEAVVMFLRALISGRSR